MNELKPCPFCGGEAAYTQILGNYERPHEVYCFTCDGGITEGRSKDGVIHNWNNRPIEDALRVEIARLQEKLHDEMSQLEIATDLGNKRWVALNDIYEDGEKHNTNWCKRIAQKGLGMR